MSTRRLLRPIAFCCSLAILACSSMAPSRQATKADPLFLDVAAAPHAFEGQTITLRGWVSLRHEDRNLWATKNDHERWQTSRCVSLSLYASLLSRVSDLDGRVVEVTGVISNDASKGGGVIRLGACRDAAIAVSELHQVSASQR
ncbi:hypothetical protein [Stenotrophomonas indicatrix]|uniref:hypothetical protein n=1 Tax=Stenotrophomonas indicatrix TaxID=2045451 RepID=UPI0024315E7C|nr:hypothetical protein [Stenotrophomonas indicatrix]